MSDDPELSLARIFAASTFDPAGGITRREARGLVAMLLAKLDDVVETWLCDACGQRRCGDMDAATVNGPVVAGVVVCGQCKAEAHEQAQRGRIGELELERDRLYAFAEKAGGIMLPVKDVAKMRLDDLKAEVRERCAAHVEDRSLKSDLKVSSTACGIMASEIRAMVLDD